jgi:hypothetical protein
MKNSHDQNLPWFYPFYVLDCSPSMILFLYEGRREMFYMQELDAFKYSTAPPPLSIETECFSYSLLKNVDVQL